MNRVITYFNSPIGWFCIIAGENGITSLEFHDKVPEVRLKSDNKFLVECINQLDEYFSGKRISFDLELDPQGTDFQMSVWKELLKIPFGKTCTYLDIATRLGNRMSLRAVGNANGRNPIPVIIPCHRVIGSNGKLVGFGGGLWRKKWLLDFEKPNMLKELF